VKVLSSMIRLAVLALGPGRLRLELVKLEHQLAR
jgi:hypothetical protein